MPFRLGANRYGKAENRVVRIHRDTARHEITDLSVSTHLRGSFDAGHTTGDQAAVLPTDSQRNAVFAFAKEHPVLPIEDYALRLARHFVGTAPAVTGALVEVEEYPWNRIDGHDHSFVRDGGRVRTTAVDVEGDTAVVTSGVTDLALLKSTGSEFHGFHTDRYTTLAETRDRVLATSLTATWRYGTTEVAWDAVHADVLATLTGSFARIHSLALQQSLFGMGEAVLETHPEIEEISFVAPNKHHVLVDLTPFDLDNPGEVFIATDRPYGLIEVSVVRE
jgi:urate oxidase